MRLAAIDIGSNAVRLLIQDVIRQEEGQIYRKKISFTRVPIRLGEDVFSTGVIGQQKAAALSKAMKAFWYLMDLNGVEHFRACATSAMREALNGQAVADDIFRDANLRIELIPGEEEADLIFATLGTSDLLNEYLQSDLLYIDVGGGSTEITLMRAGQRALSASFLLGTVRSMQGMTPDNEWVAVESFLGSIFSEKAVTKEKAMLAVGTGGNINRYHRLSRAGRGEPVSLKQLAKLHKTLSGLSYEQRIEQWGLKPDRADVILPAGEIYMKVMELAGCKGIIVPKVGLTDGIILNLFQNSEAIPSH
ncbi:MAG: exopolyphosphatase [Flavobacteriales bacterium]